ncbi:hypothetical protein ACGYLV_10335 [Sulfitobacter sp. M21595]|uniref:hypothetical protein n=1 Tax=Sulfitobacter sp. M21595 TaxID=3368574 RepID=UPI003744EFC3
MTLEIKDIPILENGQLRPEAGILILGYMLYPHCERSAKQFAYILEEETKDKFSGRHTQTGLILASILHKQPFSRLLLTGQVALRVCANHTRHGQAYFSRAAHIVSELNATNKTVAGKSLATDPGRLETTYREYQSVIHFWAAAYHRYALEDGRSISGIDAINEMHISLEFLGAFLATASQFEGILQEAKPPKYVWSTSRQAKEVWNFDYFPVASLGDEPPETIAALSSYRSRQKS